MHCPVIEQFHESLLHKKAVCPKTEEKWTTRMKSLDAVAIPRFEGVSLGIKKLNPMKQPNDNDKVWGEVYSHIKMPGNSPASQKTDIKTTASSGLVTLLIRLARNSAFIAFLHALNCLIYGWPMSNWAIRHVWGGIVALLQICFSIREAILRKIKDFLWNHFIKWRPPLLWSP